MTFNSFDFLVFFVVVYSAYLLLSHRGQNVLLLVASYFFYGSWDWRFLSLLMLSTGVDYFLAQAIDATADLRRKKALLSISLVVSLVVLGFFKYCNFFIDSLEALLASMGIATAPWHLNIILPWGISFYTFQTMNYTIDVYRGHLKASRNLMEFAVFVSFFPHLVAGPIMRATDLLPQVTRPRHITREAMLQGGWLILWGLFKKMVVADNLAVMVDRHYAPDAPVGWAISLIATYGFAFQIFCDFSAYSDIARGIGQWMGFDLMRNFRNPYLALNPSDFWRRWHISLSTWLRDYLYISLGGNRRGAVRTYINLILTMLLGGLWHGASWTFVVWGLYHGLLLAVHRLVVGDSRPNGIGTFLSRWVRIVVMFHLVCVGWIFFRAHTFTQAWAFLSSFVGPSGWSLSLLNDTLMLGVLVAPVLLMQALDERLNSMYAALKLSLVPRALLYAGLILGILLLANTGSTSFIYFQF